MSKKDFIEKKIEKLEEELHEMRVAMTTYYDEEALRAHGMREKEKKMEEDIEDWKAILSEATESGRLESLSHFIRFRLQITQKRHKELEDKILEIKEEEKICQALLLKFEELEKIE